MVDWKPLIYASLTIMLAIFGIIIIGFIPGADTQAGELFGDFRDNIFSFFEGGDDLADRYEEHFQEIFISRYDNCVDSDVKECWCLGEEFGIPSGFTMEMIQNNQKTQFKVFNEDHRNIVSGDFIVESCVMADQTSILLSALRNNKVLIESGRTSYLSFYLEDYTNILETKRDYKNEIDISIMFYKTDIGKICILDRSNAELLKNKPRCNQNA